LPAATVYLPFLDAERSSTGRGVPGAYAKDSGIFVRDRKSSIGLYPGRKDSEKSPPHIEFRKIQTPSERSPSPIFRLRSRRPLRHAWQGKKGPVATRHRPLVHVLSEAGAGGDTCFATMRPHDLAGRGKSGNQRRVTRT
jgi:hypothetical protein